ncbi:4Fe-4S binding protein [uncultured Helicobacter sp.]|uniref:4Fe-4S binding protein n=1 Tax=uncultured Helicobacter sp. TaxID=175537 RepID=UPI001C39DBCC|nr:4Fe-4S binding protein [Candidatus Helicobacter avicola]
MQRRGGILGAFSAVFKPKTDFIPLPYVKNLHTLAQCTQCEGVCATSCPEQIIIKDKESVPYLNFMIAGCTFCEECARVCQKLWGEDAPLERKDSDTIAARVSIDPLSCLAWQKTTCVSCKDACGENAIIFSASLYPEIDSQKCNACGLCYARCPSFSINIKSVLVG